MILHFVKKFTTRLDWQQWADSNLLEKQQSAFPVGLIQIIFPFHRETVRNIAYHMCTYELY